MNGDKFPGYEVLLWDEDVLLMRRSQYQEVSAHAWEGRTSRVARGVWRDAMRIHLPLRRQVLAVSAKKSSRDASSF